MARPETFEVADPTLTDGELRVCREAVDRLIADLEAALFLCNLEVALLEIEIRRNPVSAERLRERRDGVQLALVDPLDEAEDAAAVQPSGYRPASPSNRDGFH